VGAAVIFEKTERLSTFQESTFLSLTPSLTPRPNGRFVVILLFVVAIAFLFTVAFILLFVLMLQLSKQKEGKE
jgi:hypothetical protein